MAFLDKIIVAIPVRNEEGLIARCLAALSAQTRRPDHIFLLLNNCTDNTSQICRRAAQDFPAIRIVACNLQGSLASAGEARRLAFVHASALAGDGVILTTDADAAPPSTWIADNLAEIADGADAVCGKARIDSAAGIPGWHRLEFDDMRETLLLSLHDEIAALVNPDPADPWPRHQQNSGASIAVRAATLRKAGGAPHAAAGEDRALIANLRMIDAKIRHAPEIIVPVSGRLQGRAQGGMAETLSRRMRSPDLLLDDRLEPTVDAYRRAVARARLRAVYHGASGADEAATDLLVSAAELRRALCLPYFGAAWARVQALSPVLRRRRVAYAGLARETRQALDLAAQLRGEPAVATQPRPAPEYDDARRAG